MCDMVGSNRGLYFPHLRINMEITAFKNQSDANRSVYVFADAPHLLNLIRNSLLYHGMETRFKNSQYNFLTRIG